MKINSDSLSSQQATTVNQLNDLLAVLKRLDSLPARVVSNAQGQLLLSTRLGNIQPQNPLPLQPGQQVLLRIDPATGQPSVSPVKSDAISQRLAVSSNRELAQLLVNQKPALAKVVNQSQASTQIRLNGVQLAMPKLAGLNQNQLLSLRLSDSGDQIELQALDRKPLLKALLSQLIARSPGPAASPTPLLELFRLLGPQSVARSTGLPGDSASARTTTARSDTGLPASPGISVRSSAPGPSLVQSILQLLPQLSSPQANVLRQWIAPYAQQQLTNESSSTQGLNPLKLLQQVANGDLTVSRLQQILSSAQVSRPQNPSAQQIQPGPQDAGASADRTPAAGGDLSRLPDTVARQSQLSQQAQSQVRESQLNLEMLQLQSREAARLVEQIGNQAQTQRTSVSLQNEIQQPIAFALSLPVMEGKQISQLNIKVEQRNKAKDAAKQGWDVRLSFEFGAMGMVSCHIFLLGDQVSSSFYCERDETRQQFDSSLPSFRQQLIRAGFEPGDINSYPAPPRSSVPTDPIWVSESILDIEV